MKNSTAVEVEARLRTVEAAAKTAGVEGVWVHTLRHSAAVARLERGVHIKAVANCSGIRGWQLPATCTQATTPARAAVEVLSADLGL